jgi:hypothetical protein
VDREDLFFPRAALRTAPCQLKPVIGTFSCSSVSVIVGAGIWRHRAAAGLAGEACGQLSH